MTRIIGRTTKIGIGKETVRGTSVVPAFWVPVRDLDFDDTFDTTDNESGFGTIDAIQDNTIIKQWAEGGYGGKIYDKSVGMELTAVFGASPVTTPVAGATGAFQHVFTPANNNQHQSVTIAVNEANYTGRYANAVCNEWNLEMDLDDWVRRTFNIVSKKSATSSDTPTYTNENEFLPKHITVAYGTAGASLASGTTAQKVRSVKLNISKNAEGTQSAGSLDIDDVINKQLEVSGTLEFYYDDTIIKAFAQAGTHKAIRIKATNTDVSIGTGTPTNPSIQFDLAEVAFAMPKRSFDNNDISTVSVDFKAMLNLTQGYTIQATLVNTQASGTY